MAEAGQPGRITVATNMAGRGTDIRLGPGVAERGGLHVVATERSEARRIDRQLKGRCGRQGDPGSFEMLLSLEDAAPSVYFPARVLRWLGSLGGKRGDFAPLAGGLASVPAPTCRRKEARPHAPCRDGARGNLSRICWPTRGREVSRAKEDGSPCSTRFES